MGQILMTAPEMVESEHLVLRVPRRLCAELRRGEFHLKINNPASAVCDSGRGGPGGSLPTYPPPPTYLLPPSLHGRSAEGEEPDVPALAHGDVPDWAPRGGPAGNVALHRRARRSGGPLSGNGILEQNPHPHPQTIPKQCVDTGVPPRNNSTSKGGPPPRARASGVTRVS